MEEHVDTIRQHLSQAFDGPQTRSAGGQLVESMFHRALIQKTIDPYNAFKFHSPAGTLELLLRAEDFVLESHQSSQIMYRPLYLRPQSTNFAAVNAILITVDSVFLIKCTIGTSHSYDVTFLLRIIDRLQHNRIQVDLPALKLVYCLLELMSLASENTWRRRKRRWLRSRLRLRPRCPQSWQNFPRKLMQG